MKLLEKILVATDLTPGANQVLDQAGALSQHFHSKIQLLHVLPSQVNIRGIRSMVKTAALDQLKKAKQKIEASGGTVSDLMVEFGSLFDRITEIAEREDVNVIIMGHGQYGSNLGITADKVIRNSTRPVWVVRNKRLPQSILCPVDFSEPSRRALQNAISLARRLKAHLTVLAVNVPLTLDITAIDLAGVMDEANQKHTLKHKEEFEKFLKKFNLSDLQWNHEIQVGKAHTKILAALRKKPYDLLVMGTTGRTGLARILIGSVTEKVIKEAPCSFITTKSEDIIKLRLETEVSDLETHFKNAQQLATDGFLKESVDQYRICLRINPTHIPSLHGIAEVYDKLNDPEKARSYRDSAKDILQRIWDRKIESEIRKYYKL